MKVGFFGNTNNYPFTLARAMRRAGVDVTFFVDSVERLNRPEFRYGDVPVPYPSWIHDISPFRVPYYAFRNPKRSMAVRVLDQCDALVVNGLGPALASHLSPRPTVALLTGSDLAYYGDPANIDRPHPTRPRFPAPLWRAIAPRILRKCHRAVIPAQREGIARATAVAWFPKGLFPVGDAILDELGVKGDRQFFLMMADLDQLDYTPPPRNERIRVFSATRFTWKRPMPDGFTPFDDKGSDVLIEGLGRFYRATRIRLDIRFVKKGLHVSEAMDLAEREGIGDQITWLNEMSQSEVREEYKRADIVTEQFRTSLVGMAGLDAMAAGRPLIANARPEIMERWVGAPTAIRQAADPDAVCAHLIRLSDPGERQRAGLESRKYVEDYFSPEGAALLCLKKLGVRS